MADTSNSVLFDQPGPKGRRTIRIVNWVAALIFVGVLVLIDLPSGASIDWPVRFTVTRLHGTAACGTAPVPESSMRKNLPKFSCQLMTGRRIAHDNGRCHQCPRINARLKRKSRP